MIQREMDESRSPVLLAPQSHGLAGIDPEHGLRYNSPANDSRCDDVDFATIDRVSREVEMDDALGTSIGKGKEIAQRTCDTDMPLCSSESRASSLNTLPTELINIILSYLSPFDLNALGATCRRLYAHSTADHIWQQLVQDNVPGDRLTQPTPCNTFRELYQAHDPHWFLTKHKIWFSDQDLMGRLILVRYDQRRGCVEGYQLLASRNKSTQQTWSAVNDVVIHAFEPMVHLHRDRPVLQLHAHSLENLIRTKKRSEAVTTIQLNSRLDDLGEASGSSANVLYGSSRGFRPQPKPTASNRFQAETPMNIGSSAMFSNFIHARPLDARAAAARTENPFPYGHVWPPPAIPAKHRVAGVSMQLDQFSPTSDDRPTRRSEVSDQAFRIRTWLEMRGPGTDLVDLTDNSGRPLPNLVIGGGNWRLLHPGSLLDMNMPPPPGLHIGEEVATYATLDPALYTPTPTKPYRGIWVGDYSGHGCEFLLIHQPDDSEEDRAAFDPATITRRLGETDEQFEKRRWDETVYRGRLEAIKLTGDPNVPRGEFTFVADDLGEAGFVATVDQPPFHGARVVKSRGHVAHTGFLHDKYIESQLILVSPDRLAQYWVGFGHISYFERVDIDKFLKPE